ncbi:MAG: ABC transporter ATP-binding protein [Bryobacterales bacterium]|nr:ABC transporter ATP-binding protein [Bryobacterales bacterium]
MSDVAIRVEGLGKRYRIGSHKKRYKTLRESLAGVASGSLRRARSLLRGEPVRTPPPSIWALRDVTFDVRRGEVLGVIGRNGAGKSTLLKVLSRITEPTEGHAEIHGRIGSLLEVGTGFHPELTGRENIYLNGAILGMKRAEIQQQFDQIVAFAEVEQFLDTPVKRYSTGMYLRLAFGVAAHLRTEILLVDEVLAVGDAAFQKKCLGKMSEVAETGRTVLFVSHNMDAVRRLCTSVCLMRSGQLAGIGEPVSSINAYFESDAVAEYVDDGPALPGEDLRIRAVKIEQQGSARDWFEYRMPLEIAIEYEVFQPLQNLLLGFDLYTSNGVPVFRSYDLAARGMGSREPGFYRSVCRLPGEFLQPGLYYVQLLAGLHRLRWLSKEKITVGLKLAGSRESDVDFPGVLCPRGDWRVARVGACSVSP